MGLNTLRSQLEKENGIVTANAIYQKYKYIE